MSKPSLEQQIAKALTDDAITSVELGELLDQTELAIDAADQNIKAVRKRALDPIAMPDANRARAAVEDAQFAVARLRNALPRLEQRYQEAQAAEYRTQWEPEYLKAEAARDALADELADVYPKCASQLADLFGRVAEFDKQVHAINRAAPFGEDRRLAGVEVTARAGLANSGWSIAGELKLPGFDDPKQPLWPPSTPSLVEAYLAMMPMQPHRNADWHIDLDKRDQQRREGAAKVTEHYGERAKRREERENAEVRANVEKRRNAVAR